MKRSIATRKGAFICLLSVIVIGVGIIFTFNVEDKMAEAERARAYGRLSQMRVALQCYEADHGELPPLYLRDNSGKLIHSWRALILPYLEFDLLDHLDLSQPWDSDPNSSRIDAVKPRDWIWFSGGRAQKAGSVSNHILAYFGPESIWNAETGHPKGKMEEHPDAIMLISIQESEYHPMQPIDITEVEVRERISEGQTVLFLMADVGYGYGVVTLEQGALEYTTIKQAREQKDGQH